MCIAVYIGATKKLPLAKEVGERYTTFHVEAARDTEISKIRNILSSPYIYYAGSFEGCGCGFGYEDHSELLQHIENVPDKDLRSILKEDWEQRYKSVGFLSKYLERVVHDGPIEVYVTWEGTQGSPLRHQSTVTPDYFGGKTFRLEEQSLFKIIEKQRSRTA